MSESGSIPSASWPVLAKDALSRFEASIELRKLESLLHAFNVFDAIGVTHQELRHSDFLAFLLDPSQSHGLRDAFAKRFVQCCAAAGDRDTVELLGTALDQATLTETSVLRERHNIDLIIADHVHRLVIVVENKIRSNEHSDQLRRYLRTAHGLYPNWRILPVYLTPEGTAPSDGEYIALGYDVVAEEIAALGAELRGQLDPVVLATMNHYVSLLRREVLNDSEVASLCRLIYRSHRQAIDLIIDHRPNYTADLSDFLIELIEAAPETVFTKAPNKRRHIQFTHPEWDLPWMFTDLWRPSRKLLLFQFVIEDDNRDLRLELLVGKGEEAIRQAIMDRVPQHSSPFTVQEMGRGFTRIYVKQFLDSSQMESEDINQIVSVVRDEWQAFLDNDLPALASGLQIDSMNLPPNDGGTIGMGVKGN